MSVGLKLGNVIDEIGSADLLHAFFSTISGNLEPDGWGTRFPVLMKKLYQGSLKREDADAAIDELAHAREELGRLPVSKIIWDVEDPQKPQPSREKIDGCAADLSKCFVTSFGRDILNIFSEVLHELRTDGGTLRVVDVWNPDSHGD